MHVSTSKTPNAIMKLKIIKLVAARNQHLNKNHIMVNSFIFSNFSDLNNEKLLKSINESESFLSTIKETLQHILSKL